MVGEGGAGGLGVGREEVAKAPQVNPQATSRSQMVLTTRLG